ncbi:hypothetical protein ICM49_06630 [Leucobacter sp. cx-169]|nr:hypothetical protein [Leucobacter sp. cx-169]
METTRSTPKARVRHWCEVCGWAIEPGETYARVVRFYDGTASTWKNHVSPCQTAINRAWAAEYHDGDDGVSDDDISEWASGNRDTDEVAAEIHRRLEINAENSRAHREALARIEGQRQ